MHSVRTFKPRRRRLGPLRQRRYDEMLPRFGLDEDGDVLDVRSLFGGPATICIEIGCGNGDLASSVARRRPDIGLVAVDVHRPGIARLLSDIHEHGLANLRVVDGDALVFLERLPSGSVDEVWAFFPDPWPKNSQAHRRLIEPARLERLLRVLVPGGRLRLATDVSDYADRMRRVLAESDLIATIADGRPEWHVDTAYERAGRAAGRDSVDLVAIRI